MKNVNMYILSDSLGNTAEHVAKAAMAQYENIKFNVIKYSHVENLEILDEILHNINSDEDSMILFTIVDKELVLRLKEFCEKTKIQSVDLLCPVLDGITLLSDEQPLVQTGMLRRLNEKYFKRVESIEFAVKYDDGKDPRGVLKADLVIIGVSRTSKTPLSMYLANKNIKVANIPLVPEAPVPKELFEIPSKKIVGLTNTPEKLNEIRTERLKSMGLSITNANENKYANMDRILEEIAYAEDIMKKIGCPIINVSNRAIEETAEKVIGYLKKSGTKIYNE